MDSVNILQAKLSDAERLWNDAREKFLTTKKLLETTSNDDKGAFSTACTQFQDAFVMFQLTSNDVCIAKYDLSEALERLG